MDDLPPFLSDCRMMDVTAEYLPVSDVEIEVTDTIPAEESVYLAVYSDDWTATAYTDTYQNRIATFKDVKNEMLYMPVVYRKGNIDVYKRQVIRTVVNLRINYDPLLQTENEFNQLLIITL